MLLNICKWITVWPGLFGGRDEQISTTGFKRQKGESRTITAPPTWSGWLWGRTLCAVKSTTRNFTCVTGYCGSDKVECSGGGPAPPTTLLEFTSGRPNEIDYFDVSVVDGYNLPMLAVPQGDRGAQCSSASCVMDLNGFCPAELQVSDGGGEVVACKGSCLALRQDRSRRSRPESPESPRVAEKDGNGWSRRESPRVAGSRRESPESPRVAEKDGNGWSRRESPRVAGSRRESPKKDGNCGSGTAAVGRGSEAVRE
ncbi:hypothetical protein RJ640_011837 [Escallonia rubra]|uniref:Thaumatin-like protein n=1 Tax=Escallonia rubra TaxID=112253 RepID=A0AA88U7L1_9ASTE|nr:hypothetical protein RJ640_011837 [Escallonia rubra]